MDVAAGATVDVSNLPASPPAVVSTLPSRGDDDGDNSTAAVTAAVEAFGIRDRGGEGEGGGGGEGAGVVAEETHRVRVRFVDQEGVVLEEEEPEEEEEEGEGEGEEEEEDDDMEGGVRAGGREEIARILSERFLAGEEEGVDYKDVDGDERLDDLDQLARDEVGRELMTTLAYLLLPSHRMPRMAGSQSPGANIKLLLLIALCRTRSLKDTEVVVCSLWMYCQRKAMIQAVKLVRAFVICSIRPYYQVA